MAAKTQCASSSARAIELTRSPGVVARTTSSCVHIQLSDPKLSGDVTRIGEAHPSFHALVSSAPVTSDGPHPRISLHLSGLSTDDGAHTRSRARIRRSATSAESMFAWASSS